IIEIRTNKCYPYFSFLSFLERNNMPEKRITGSYEKLGNLESFIPYPLPPQKPTLILTPETIQLYGKAMLRLGQLNEMAQRVPDPQRFIKAYVIKEALLSSAI